MQQPQKSTANHINYCLLVKQIEWMVRIIAGSCNVQVKCFKNSAINVQVDNQDSALYDCLMFILLALYLPNTILDVENMKCRNILLTTSSLGGKGISRLQVIYHLKP
jgi:hypothetical protein